MSTYSFLDVNASLVGPGGAINIGAGAAASEEGITVAPADDIDKMVVAADGTPMHSLLANKSGTLSVVLLKTSPVNQKLMALYNVQTANPASHGQNTISVVTKLGQDVVTCRSVAFKKVPDLKYAAEAGTNEWQFNCGIIDRALGSGY
jgi:hypothetical protein